MSTERDGPESDDTNDDPSMYTNDDALWTLSLKAEIAGIANTYTNVLRLKERVQVMEEQLNLKYAALDSWK